MAKIILELREFTIKLTRKGGLYEKRNRFNGRDFGAR